MCHLAALSRSPFVTAAPRHFSHFMGTAFGWCYHQPALKGEVANEVSRRGCIVAALVCVTPSVKPSVCQLPVKGSLLVRH